MTALECALCHRSAPDVQYALMAFDNGDAPAYYGTDARCPDHEACRARVEARGEDWPLITAEKAQRLAAGRER